MPIDPTPVAVQVRTGRRTVRDGSVYASMPYRAMRQPRITRWLSYSMGVFFIALLAVALIPINAGPFDNRGWLRLGARYMAIGDGNNAFEFVMWILWLPLLVVTTFLFGRLWCGNLCPLRRFTDGARSLGEKLGLGKGAATRRSFRLGWLLPSSFILVTLVVKGWPVQEEARLGAIFFLVILAVAGGVGFSFRSGTWCRYLCPVGGWLARITRLSPVTLRPDREICATCSDKPCITGTAVAGRCPTALNPSRLETSRDCLTCWNCVANCPSERASLRLHLRAPGAELLGPTQPNLWESLFVASLLGMYMAVGQQSATLSHLTWPVRFFGLIGLTTVVYIVVCGVSGPLAGVSWRHALSTFGYAFLPLELATALISMGDDALSFLNIEQTTAIVLLGVGFAWSAFLLVPILRNHSRTPLRALMAGVPLAVLLVSVLVVWLHWYAGSGFVAT